ncbi:MULTISPECIES: hypothetical protein [unclassified Pseudodesulfovibrio]|uniref:hypothetical protein n=1 Tax=unclassified Pseudodesulfovibrio TaxID=2661612 RepID=UPI0013E38F8C|nr:MULTISPECIES: hypothetical protein [unclassified Pseudodesulfovibrio]MCJ2165143.1 hypothetical protein [Pseudodesulfovibrio sp. S3-i]
MKWQCSWIYLFHVEDSSTEARDCPELDVSRLLRTGKAVLWVGISVLMGMGVSQLG